MNNFLYSKTISIGFSDVTFHTIMDTGFYGMFGMVQNMHTHPFYEIQAVVTGIYSIEFPNHDSVSDRLIRMEGDMLCLVPPSCYHCSLPISDNPQKLALRFSCELSENDKHLTPLYASFGAVLSGITEPYVLHSAELCAMLLQIHKELVSPEVGADVMAQLHLSQFYIKLLRFLDFYHPVKTQTGNRTPKSYDSRYNQIEWYFGDHFAHPITEDDLAVTLGLSKRQTSRVLQQIYGMSFREKLVSIRMNNAAGLLMRTDTAIDQIARMVGYETTAGFLAAFKKFFGISCVEYRANYGKSTV